MRSFLCVVVSTLLATVACHEEFQCTFPNEDLVPDVGIDERIVDQHIWGAEVQPLAFQTQEEFQSFEKKFIEEKKKFYKGNIFDTIHTYFNLYDESRQYEYYFQPNETYSDKIRDFSIGYIPDEFGSDRLGLLVRFLRQVSAQLPEVEKHVFFGIYVAEVSKEELVKYVGDNPAPDALDNEFPVGLIKVSIGGKLGFIVIDMEYAKTKLVMEDNTGPKNDKISYLIDSSQKNIQINFHRFNNNSQTFGPPIRTDVIYVGRPLCSFVETHVRYTLLYPHAVKLLSYGPDFELDAALVAQIFRQRGVYYRFRLTYRRFDNTENANPKYTYLTKYFHDDDDFNDDFELNFFTHAAIALFDADATISQFLLMEKIKQVQRRPYYPRGA